MMLAFEAIKKFKDMLIVKTQFFIFMLAIYMIASSGQLFKLMPAWTIVRSGDERPMYPDKRSKPNLKLDIYDKKTGISSHEEFQNRPKLAEITPTAALNPIPIISTPTHGFRTNSSNYADGNKLAIAKMPRPEQPLSLHRRPPGPLSLHGKKCLCPSPR